MTVVERQLRDDLDGARAALRREQDARAALRVELDRVRKAAGEKSDGYHTFDELYDHRITLFIALCAEVDRRTPTGYVWRSKLHSDGTMFDGWFVMGIGTERGDQITYHLPLSRWAETEWLGTARPRAPDFDGHTAADVLARLQRHYLGAVTELAGSARPRAKRRR